MSSDKWISPKLWLRSLGFEVTKCCDENGEWWGIEYGGKGYYQLDEHGIEFIEELCQRVNGADSGADTRANDREREPTSKQRRLSERPKE